MTQKSNPSYKAIVSDFDGTLVDESNQLNPEVKQAIKKFVKNGGIFSIATGRDYYGVIKDLSLELGLKTLHITRGGAEIISTETHQVVWGKYIPKQKVKRLLDFLDQFNDICFIAERGQIIYTKGAKPYAMFGPKARFGDLDKMPLENVPKVFLPPTENEPDQALSVYEKIKNEFPDLHVIKSTSGGGKYGMDINQGGVSKHLALLEYAQLLKLDPKEIIGVGDSYNDYPLLEACGLKVAMGNAPQELLEVADQVVATQAEDGILEVLAMFNKK